MPTYPTYKLGDVAEIILGQSPESKSYNTKGEGLPFFQGKSEFTDWFPVPNKWCTEPKKIAEPLDILLSVRAPVGPTNVAKEKCCIGRGLAAIRYPECYKYVLYYLRSVSKHLESKATGTTFSSISGDTIKNLPIPLPPLPTQHQIVSRIESLFAELDKAAKHLRTAQQQLKTYRQAVLRDAFEGCKEMKTVLELSTIVTSGSRGWAKYYIDKKDARFVRITDLTRDRIILQSNNIQYISLPPNAEGKRSLLQPNDVLVSITADLGSIALVPQNIGEAYINQHIAMIRFKNTKLGKFMAYYLKSDFGQKELLKNKRGNGKLGLGLDDIRNTYIPFVDEEEANEIVNKIESRLSQAEAAEASITEALQKTETLRQSILKKAFSGELNL